MTELGDDKSGAAPRATEHGGALDRAAREWSCTADEILDLSTGVYPERRLERLRGWLAENAELVRRYPDPDGEPARSALAATLGVSADRLLMLSGAQSFVDRIFDVSSFRSVALADPEYGEVERCARRAGYEVIKTPPDAPLAEADLHWVTSPNSHTGSCPPSPTRPADVLDESYASLARRVANRDLACLRVGSLTKTFSLAGLRLGYVVGSEDQIERLREIQPPWPASSLALHLLPELLPNWSELDWRAGEEVERLAHMMTEAGCAIWGRGPSFVLVKQRSVSDFAREKILVRHYPSGSPLESAVRIGLPTTEEDWLRLGRAMA